MSVRQPKPPTVEIGEARERLISLVDRVVRGNTRVIVEQGGVPVAALVSPADLQRLDRLDREQAEDWAVLEAMRAPFRGVPPEEIERETSRVSSEVRDETRRERQQPPVER